MKNNFKFIVAVLGVTIATLGSIKSNAIDQPNNTPLRCCAPYTNVCCRTADGKLLLGQCERDLDL